MKTLPLLIAVTVVAFVATLVKGQSYEGYAVVTADPTGEDSTVTTAAPSTGGLTPDPFFGYGYGCPNCGGYGPRGWGRPGMGWGMRGGRWGMRGGPGWRGGRGRHWGGMGHYGMMGYRRGYGPPWAPFDDRKDNSDNNNDDDDNVPCFCPYPPPGYGPPGPRGYNGVDGYRNTEYRRRWEQAYLNHPCCNPQNEGETTIQ